MQLRLSPRELLECETQVINKGNVCAERDAHAQTQRLLNHQ